MCAIVAPVSVLSGQREPGSCGLACIYVIVACICVINYTGLDVEVAGNWSQVSPRGAYE